MKPGVTSLASAYAKHAVRSPDHVAIQAEDLSLSARNLWRVAQTYAAIMSDNGIAAGQTVALDTTDTIVSVSAILATSLLGAVLVPYHPSLPENDLFAVDRILRSVERPQQSGENALVIDGSWSPKAPSW